MKTLVLVSLGATALALANAGCASDLEDEEPVAEEASSLRSIGGGAGDPDECMAALAACYQSCTRSGSASCYRYCDRMYAACRGLPEPGVVTIR